MMKIVILAVIGIACIGVVFAATPTDCNYGNYCGFGGQCVPTDAGSICSCFQGFRVSNVTFECVDINECADSNYYLCPGGLCLNIVGTYKCWCPPGFVPHYPDGKTCERVRPQTNNNNFLQRFLFFRLMDAKK